MAINRFEVYLVTLDPTLGSEIKKTRPCLVISPDEMNHRIRTVIVAPMTTGGKLYPTRIPCRFRGKNGYVVLDQIRIEVGQHQREKSRQIADGIVTKAHPGAAQSCREQFREVNRVPSKN